MSKTIEEIIEVIEEVCEKFEEQTKHSNISNLRISAIHSVAKRRGIEYQTVLDKCVRRLQPYVKNTSHFDDLLEDWLINDSDELRNFLLKRVKNSHNVDSSDLELINNTFNKVSESDILPGKEFEQDQNDEHFKEGQLKLHLRVEKERNPDLVNRAKEKWNREQNGRVHCSICSFSFQETYGEVGEGFIEAHHTKPISSLAKETTVSVEDLAPVCSNCHSILHRYRPWFKVKELRTIFFKTKEINTIR